MTANDDQTRPEYNENASERSSSVERNRETVTVNHSKNLDETLCFYFCLVL